MVCMDRLSFLITPEYSYFVVGCVFILAAMFSVYFGVCPGRWGSTYRDKDPKTFWFAVAIYFVFGIFFWICFWNQPR
jgi:hypothetical protein